MPNRAIQLIKDKAPLKDIEECLADKPKLPLFQALQELEGQSLYSYLEQYTKLGDYSLKDFILKKLIDFQERDVAGKNLMQHIVKKDELEHFQSLLLAGEKPTEETRLAAEESLIKEFLTYQPGKNNPTVFDLATEEKPDIQVLSNLIYDFYDTSSDESSDPEVSDTEELTLNEKKLFKKSQSRVIRKYNKNQTGADEVRLVAARGVHFLKEYFPKETRELTRRTRKNPHTTYSASTLFDSGYDAEHEPEEDDMQMLQIHQRNLGFIDRLKQTPDRKEKKTGNRKAPAQRNKKVFENLFWREVQVYINSYDTLFNSNGIQINFSFASNNNPHLSLSWKTDVAGKYGSGVRFSWDGGQRRDPHYRRYDGKPKHPNLGFVDIFEFPIDYVRANAVDRLLAYNKGLIDLSNIHLAEAEIIIHSMIPKQFHKRRYMIVLPSFERKHFEENIDDKYFGINDKGTYTRARNAFFKATKGMKKEKAYQHWVKLRTEHAVDAQSTLIDRESDLRLYRNGKVRAFDHGDSIKDTLPKPQR